MSIHLNISNCWKPVGLGQIVAMSKEINQPISQWILETDRQLATSPLALGDQSTHQVKGK